MTFTSADETFMRRALALAEQAGALGEVPVGAVLVQDGQIIGEGFNQPIRQHDPTAHAEIQAIRMAAHKLANYRLVNTTLYVTLEPCSMCAGALVHARVDRLIYAAAEPKAGVAESQQAFFESPFLNHRVMVMSGLLQLEASRLLSDFFKHRRLEKKKDGSK
ncbi:MAG: tRNA adenosine(34) deaminase TadA [Cellvibrionales bacterium]|nr:tRNA adenosine(34) deaminase TadA [Cellvibrionales bacterium]